MKAVHDTAVSRVRAIDLDNYLLNRCYGRMVGLVLGVVRFPRVMSIETSASIAAGTNLGISTLGAITLATPNNWDYQAENQ